jgi:hypothetical protein
MACLFRLLLSTIGQQRQMADYSDVRRVTYLMLVQAAADVEAEQASRAERPKYYYGHQEEEETASLIFEGKLEAISFPKLVVDK